MDHLLAEAAVYSAPPMDEEGTVNESASWEPDNTSEAEIRLTRRDGGSTDIPSPWDGAEKLDTTASIVAGNTNIP